MVTHLYWSNHQSVIFRIPKGGGVPEAVVSGLDHPAIVAVDATGLNWTTEGTAGATVMRVAR